MSYELSFEPPETWVCLFREMLAFTFLSEIISHSTFIASSVTDLCIGRRGTLIKCYSCHWNQNHNSSFPIPLPDSKNEMTLVPLGFGLCRRTKSPNMGLYFNSMLGWQSPTDHTFWCHLIITSPISLWALAPSSCVWAPTSWR